MKKQKAERFTRRSFTWGIKASEIAFMHVSPAEAAMDGSSSDCGCEVARFGRRRATRPAGPGIGRR